MPNENFYSQITVQQLQEQQKQATKKFQEENAKLKKVIAENISLKDKVSALVITVRNLTDKMNDVQTKYEALQLECQNLLNIIESTESNDIKP